MPTIRIDTLPEDHPARNVPLLSIEAGFRWIGAAEGKGWHKVKPSWKIAGVTFNQLAPAWTRSSQWRGNACISTTGCNNQ